MEGFQFELNKDEMAIRIGNEVIHQQLDYQSLQIPLEYMEKLYFEAGSDGIPLFLCPGTVLLVQDSHILMRNSEAQDPWFDINDECLAHSSETQIRQMFGLLTDDEMVADQSYEVHIEFPEEYVQFALNVLSGKIRSTPSFSTDLSQLTELEFEKMQNELIMQHRDCFYQFVRMLRWNFSLQLQVMHLLLSYDSQTEEAFRSFIMDHFDHTMTRQDLVILLGGYVNLGQYEGAFSGKQKHRDNTYIILERLYEEHSYEDLIYFLIGDEDTFTRVSQRDWLEVQSLDYELHKECIVGHEFVMDYLLYRAGAIPGANVFYDA